MKHSLKTLPNKLQLLTVPISSLDSATVMVWVRAGSRNEKSKEYGLSHFLEHMAFKGGKKYPSAKAVSQAIDEVGGEFNASTSKEITRYYIRIRTKLLERAFDVLSDIVISPNLNEKEIAKEKGVILEEMNMYEDTPVRRVWDLFEQLMFKGHLLEHDIIGTKETVPLIKKGDFTSYRERYYKGGNMLISVAGGVNEMSIKTLTEEYFGKIEKGSGTVRKNTPKVKKGKISLTTKQVEQAHIILGFPAEELGNGSRYKDALLNIILGSGMSSRLFTEVREKRGLAYSVRSDIDRFIDAGYFAVYAGVDPKNAEEAIKVILNELYGIANKTKKIEKKELEKAKEYIKGHLALSLEDTRQVTNFFGHEQLMLGKVRTPDEVYRNVERITAHDIYKSAQKLFKKGKIKLAIIGPFKDKKKFEKIIT